MSLVALIRSDGSDRENWTHHQICDEDNKTTQISLSSYASRSRIHTTTIEAIDLCQIASDNQHTARRINETVNPFTADPVKALRFAVLV